jgi:hypothetical protein
MNFDRLKASLFALIDLRTARLDFFASYPCRVVSQNEDGSLELKPDDPRVGAGLSAVPVRGLPGVVARVKTTARVLLTWEGGDPAKPIATLFEAHSLERLEVTASVQMTVTSPTVVLGQEEGAKRVACVGDVIQAAMPALMPVSGVIVAANIEGLLAGVPFAGAIQNAPFTGFLNVVEPVLGVIDGTAQSRVQAG